MLCADRHLNARRTYSDTQRYVLQHGAQHCGYSGFGNLDRQQNVFYNTPLTSIVIPNHVDTIGQGCFNQCKKLRKAVIGTGTRVIAKSAFNSTALDSISLPEGLVEIQQLGISVNPYLKSMVLPSTLTTLGARSLFRNSFTSVTAKMTTPPNIREDLTNKIFADYTDWQGDSIYTYCTLYVPKGSLEV